MVRWAGVRYLTVKPRVSTFILGRVAGLKLGHPDLVVARPEVYREAEGTRLSGLGRGGDRTV